MVKVFVVSGFNQPSNDVSESDSQENSFMICVDDMVKVLSRLFSFQIANFQL